MTPQNKQIAKSVLIGGSVMMAISIPFKWWLDSRRAPDWVAPIVLIPLGLFVVGPVLNKPIQR